MGRVRPEGPLSPLSEEEDKRGGEAREETRPTARVGRPSKPLLALASVSPLCKETMAEGPRDVSRAHNWCPGVRQETQSQAESLGSEADSLGW